MFSPLVINIGLAAAELTPCPLARAAIDALRAVPTESYTMFKLAPFDGGNVRLQLVSSVGAVDCVWTTGSRSYTQGICLVTHLSHAGS